MKLLRQLVSALSLLLSAGLGFAQNTITVGGQVVDNFGEALPGVSVIVKGTGNATSTAIDGKFSIAMPAHSTLQFLCMGYADTEQVFNSSENNVTVVMNVSSEMLDEAVFVGYGTMRRGLVTSAISKISVDESKIRPVDSPAGLLSGRIAGVTSSTVSGSPGSAEKVSIRGTSSISAGNEPLYVIDGIPIDTRSANLMNFGEDMSPLAVLNVDDIESIEILKDAASSAIYGSRASNGVVIITTKSGKQGAATINVNVSTGVSQFANPGRLRMATTEEYIKQFNEGVDNYNIQNGYDSSHKNFVKHITDPSGKGETTDWLSYATRLGQFVNTSLSMSGGNKTTNYYIGGTYSYNEGIIKTNSIRKTNLKAKVSHQFNKHIELGANVSGNYMKNYQIPGVQMGSMILGRCVLQRPFDKPYNEDGSYTIGGTSALTYHNPVSILNEATSYFETYRYLGSYYLTLKFLDGKLQFKNTLDNDITQTYDYKNYSSKHPYVKNFGVVDINRTTSSMLLESVLSYNDTFADGAVDFSAILGHSYQTLNTHYAKLEGKGFPSDVYNVIGVAGSVSDFGGDSTDYDLESYFARANFAYNGKYLATLTLRTDGSSKFSAANRWGWFPSVSFGWNASKEEFLKDKGFDLKIRASYGQTGNQEGIGYYAYLAKMSGGYNYGGGSGIAVNDFGNVDLTWEKAGQFDAGFDLSLLNDRLTFIFDYYHKNTTDLLYARPVYSTAGTSSIISNVGAMTNQGVEFTISSNFNIGKVNWASNFNITHNQNKVTKLLDDSELIVLGANNSTTYGTMRALKVGEELGAFYLYKHDGIYQSDDEVPESLYKQGVRAGDIRYKDNNNDGSISDADRQVIGRVTPVVQGGWSNTFTWKNLSCDIFFTYSLGNDVYSSQEFNYSRRSYKANITQEHALNCWNGKGSTNWYPRSYYNGSWNNKNSDFFLHDGSFLRLRTIALAYQLPSKFVKKLSMKSVSVRASVDNAFLISDYPGWDPECNSNTDARYAGAENLNVPQPRVWSLGLKVAL